MKKYLYKLPAPAFLGLLVLAGNAFAQVPAATPKGTFPWDSPGLEASEITDLAGGMAEFLFILAGIIMGIVIVWAGIVYMAAGSDATRVNKAKAILKWGIVGAIVIFGVETIINTLQNFADDPSSFFD